MLLTPIHASARHGYDTLDPFRLDERLGTDDDFDRFVAACRARDLRLVLDGVFNHVGAGFVAPSEDWFLRGADGGRRAWEGHEELVELDHANPAVLAWAVDVARHWLSRGADGWRLDVAYAVPAAFWRAWSAAVRSSFPSAWLVGEVIHGDYAGFVAASGLDGVTQYELHKAIWSSLADRNPFELSWALQRHAAMASSFAPVTFVGNHDVTRLASHLPDPAQRSVAAAVLLTVPGVPCVYYGDELGAVGVKEDRAGGDDAIRPSLSSLDRMAVEPWWPSLIRWRRERPWLTTAALVVDSTSNDELRYTVTGAGDGEVVRVTIRPDGYELA